MATAGSSHMIENQYMHLAVMRDSCELSLTTPNVCLDVYPREDIPTVSRAKLD